MAGGNVSVLPKPARHSALVVFVLALSPWAHGQAPKQEEQPKTFDLAAIDAYVARQVRDQKFVGLAVAIVRDGKVVFAKGYGKRSIEDGSPIEADTPFAVGSLTKQFTCASVLLLAEEGKLSLDGKVANYYPSLTRAADISLYDLMTHTSGYPDYYPLDFVDRRLMKPIRAADLLSIYAKGKLDFEPNTRWSYSNTGYVLLGGIVAKVSGMPFGRFLEDRILHPLGMKHSAFEPATGMNGQARGHTSFALGPVEPATYESSGWLSAAGGLWASASDIALWDIALLNGLVLKPDSLRVMTSARTLLSGHSTGYACGLNVERRGGETVLSHGGAVSGFLATNAVIPRFKSAVVVLSNAEHCPPNAVQSMVLDLLLAELKKQANPHVPHVHGLAAKEAAAGFLHELQAGKVNRQNLGEEFNVLLTDERITGAGARLKALGEPEGVAVENIGERGGMEVASVRFTFKNATLEGLLYRTPDGKIQQLLLRTK
jgi:D-alanyl-D-alanine carboxypeptidase